jgi:hypothetical protein
LRDLKLISRGFMRTNADLKKAEAGVSEISPRSTQKKRILNSKKGCSKSQLLLFRAVLSVKICAFLSVFQIRVLSAFIGG